MARRAVIQICELREYISRVRPRCALTLHGDAVHNRMHGLWSGASSRTSCELNNSVQVTRCCWRHHELRAECRPH